MMIPHMVYQAMLCALLVVLAIIHYEESAVPMLSAFGKST